MEPGGAGRHPASDYGMQTGRGPLGPRRPGRGRDTCPAQRGASFLAPGALGSHALKAGSALDSPRSTQHPSA